MVTAQHTPIPPRPVNQYRMFLTCYGDEHIYGWHHVDLFVHDELGREVNWVHWTVQAEGPDEADASVRLEEPDLRRTTPWEHHVSDFGMEYWTAEAEWA